jgi:hypothetical protein
LWYNLLVGGVALAKNHIFVYNYTYNITMNFEWDEAKRQTNLQKHRLDFAEAESVFAGATFTFEETRFEYDEDRYVTLGLLRGVVVVLAHTEREDVIRVISMRKATKNEQRLYFESFAG